MASPVRRLRELLKEKQEPFLLDVYLKENGFSRRSRPHLETRNYGCHLGKSCKKISSSTTGLNSRKQGLPKSSNLLKSVLTKLVSGKNSKTLSCIGKAYDGGRFDDSSDVSGIWKKTHVSGLNQLSPGRRRLDSSSIPEKDFYRSDGRRAPLKLCTSTEQAAAGRQYQWGCKEDFKQFSPVSVLEVPSDEASHGQLNDRLSARACKEERTSTSSLNLPKEVLEDSILTASLWDPILKSIKRIHSLEVLGPAFSFQCMKTKRFLRRTKQLPLDSPRELVDNHGNRSRNWNNANGYLGHEMLGDIISDKILSWSKQNGDVTNITQLLESDFNDSKRWNHFQPHKKELGIELGDGLFENIIDEIVNEMLELLN